MRRRPIRLVLLATVALVIVAPTVHALVTPTRVLGGPGDQFWPFATDEWLAYSFWDGGRNAAMARLRPDGNIFRLNEARTSGVVGGIDPGTDVAIYQQYGDGSAIYLYDLGDRTRRKAPGVNSTAWEWDPRISATSITFFRNRRRAGIDYVDLLRYRRDTGALTRIAAMRRSRFEFNDDLYLWNGSVGERYVTWVGCAKPDGDCDVYVHDTVERTTKTITGGRDKQEYAGVVDEANGVVYFTRSGIACGVNVGIWWIAVDHLASAPTKVGSLPDGFDAGYTASINVNEETSGTDYYFGRGSCSRWNEDVYVAAGVDTA